MRNRVLSYLLCFCMLASMSTTVFATDDYTATTTANVTVASMVFDITVPTELPVTVDAYGVVATADAESCVITNNSGGMVYVSNIAVSKEGEWEIVDYDTEFKEKSVDLTQFGMTLNGDEVSTDGSVIKGENWETLSANGGTLNIDYGVNISSQSSAISDTIATVEFTFDWESVETAQTYTVTVPNTEGNSYFTVTGAGAYAEGEVVTLTFDSINYTVAYDYTDIVDENGDKIECITNTLGNAGGEVTFYMPANDLELYLIKVEDIVE